MAPPVAHARWARRRHSTRAAAASATAASAKPIGCTAGASVAPSDAPSPILRHGTWETDESELRRVAPDSGEVLEALDMPEGMLVSGMESDGRDLLYCGGGRTGTLRAVRRPRRS